MNKKYGLWKENNILRPEENIFAWKSSEVVLESKEVTDIKHLSYP